MEGEFDAVVLPQVKICIRHSDTWNWSQKEILHVPRSYMHSEVTRTLAYILPAVEKKNIYEAGTRSEQQGFWGHGQQPLRRPRGTAGIEQGAGHVLLAVVPRKLDKVIFCEGCGRSRDLVL